MLKKEGVFIKKVLLNLYIKNNSEEYNYENIESIIKKDIIFNINNDKYIIENNKDEVILHKENNNTKLDLVFNKSKKTDCTYYIKDMDYYIDTKVETVILENNKDINIKYKLYLQDEYVGEFIFKIELKV